ncbi:hypothetical protein LIER_07806 [Lithospermum erythrorhizon]|uniref:Nuclease associated modular domain-containing protein n=1 Tax=Lithospermum erythrorhizon TaxID=34254 RepID=A0AAV3PBL0_LITER
MTVCKQANSLVSIQANDQFACLVIVMHIIRLIANNHAHNSTKKLVVPHIPVSCIRSTAPLQRPAQVLDCTRNLITIQFTPEVSLMKTGSISLSFVNSFVSLHHTVLHANYAGDDSHYTQLSIQESGTYIYNKQILAGNTQENDNCKRISLINQTDSKDGKEMQRRRKIGLANKGKIPWNKGKKHSTETCEKIKQKTKEAMSDPKVRKKISECPRSRSEQTKAKIQSSLRKLWGQRLKWKRSREKFLQSWAESIARSAKIGFSDQQELQWNSYDIMEREIALQQLLCAEEKAKEKETSRMKRSQAKEERMERLAHKSKKRDEKRKARNSKKPKKGRNKLDVVHGVNLKAMIMKVHKKKTTISQPNVQRQLVWENIDLELVKREMLQKEVSLADQIRVAKNYRERYLTPKIIASPLLPEAVVHE